VRKEYRFGKGRPNRYAAKLRGSPTGWFRNRRGKAIGLSEWARLREDLAYIRVAIEKLPFGRRISTVWIGLDMSFGLGRAATFETAVFSRSGKVLDMCKYDNEADAVQGHRKMVTLWKRKVKR